MLFQTPYNNRIKIWLLVSGLLLLQYKHATAQAQCANGVLNVAINTPTVPAGCRPVTVGVSSGPTSGSGEATATYQWFINGVLLDSVVNTGNRNLPFNPGVYTIQVVGRATTGCLDTATRVINVSAGTGIAGIFDPPRITAPSLRPIWTRCNTNPNNPSNSFTMNVVTQAPDTLKNYTIIWGDATPNTTGAVSAPGNLISHTYSTLGEFNVTIINDNGSCVDTIRGLVRNLRPVTATILPLPAGQLAGCAPHTITFTDSTENALPGTVLTWNFGVGQATVVRNHTQANSPISYTYPREASQQCIFTVSLTAFNSNCNSGPPSTVSISPILIFDEDIADITVATPLCDSTRTITFQNTSQLNCETGQRLWFWDFGDGTNTGWITSQGAQVHTFPTFGTYTVMLIDSNFCGADTTFETIVVNRPPLVGFTLNPKQGCVPLNVAYTDTSLGLGITRVWNFGAGSGIANRTDSTNTVTFNNPGTFVVTLTATNVCASRSAVDTVKVFAKPTVRIRTGPNGCAPFTRTFLDSTFNQSPTATYKWTFGNGDSSILRNPPPITYVTPGSYIVKLVVTDTCGADSFTTTVNVFTVPTASFTATTVCRGDSTAFTNTSSLAMGDVVAAFKWYFGDGDSSTLAAPKHVYLTDGAKQAVLRIQTDKGCIDFDTVTVLVDVSPIVTITSANSACDTNSIAFDGNATTAIGTITAYRWTFGLGTADTAVSEDTVYIFPGPGVYTVRLKVDNSTGCSFTQQKNITIHPIPDARPTASNFCFGQSVQFRDSSTVGFANTIDSTLWDFTNNQSIDAITPQPVFQYPSDGVFTAKLRVVSNNGCANTDSLLVTIHPLPNASFTIDALSKCKLDSFVFTNTSTGAVLYRWTYGDGNPDSVTGVLTPIAKAYADTGSFPIRLIATTSFGCRDTLIQTIQSRPFPVARFTVNDSISCAPKNFEFTNTSILADQYSWRVNGNQTSIATNRPDTFIATSGQTFIVSLIANNVFGCKPDTVQKTLQTIANPIPVFTASVDSGCGPLAVTFTNASIGATSFEWTLGNGANALTTNASSVYSASLVNDSIYTVKLVALNGPGCKDSTTQTITVFPQPESKFIPNQTANCGPLAVAFTNQSVHHFGGVFADLTFVWNFGNGIVASTADTVNTFFASAVQDTVYSVQLIATTRFGCSDTSNTTVRVFPNPTAQFLVNQDNGCAPFPVQFINTSVPNDTGSISIMTFDWDFRNGATTNTQSPIQSFNASAIQDTIYAVRLTAFSEHGCSDTAIRPIRIYPKPRADFTMVNDSGCTPFNAVFTNTSVPFDTGTIADMSFVWDLGNGFGSITQNAFAQYNSRPLADSTYTIRLFATSEHGCRDTIAKQVVSHPLPIASFTNSNGQGCGPLQVQFTSSSLLAANHRWHFGDGVSSNAANPMHIFQSYDLIDSIYQVTLSVQSAFGCESDTVFGNIIARYQPVADFIPARDSICNTGVIAFTNLSIGGVSNQWNFGNGFTSATINPASTFAALPTRDTTYTIRLVIATPYNCRDTAFKTVKVNPLPDAQFSATASGCTPLPISLSNTSVRATAYAWDFGDGSIDSAVTPIKTLLNTSPLATTAYTITLTAVSNSGCIDTAKRTVLVRPEPVAQISPNLPDGCGPLAVSFNNTSASNFFGSVGMTFDWQMGNGQTATNRNATATYVANADKDTLYTARLIAVSEFGCRDTVTQTIRVYPKPEAIFTVDADSGCTPLAVAFTNTSSPKDTGTIADMSFVWDFGNGFNAVTQQANALYFNNTAIDTVFRARLFASSEHGCRDTATQFIRIHPKPIASFTQDRIQGCGPYPVAFTSTSQNSTQFKWYFGDGDSTQLQNPTHVFQSVPLIDTFYRVQLVTRSAFGCQSDTVFRNIFGRAIPVAQFASSDDSTCNPGTISFFNASQGAATNSWNFGNGFTSTAFNPSMLFTGPATRDTTYTVRLVVTSPATCRDTAFKTIKVNPLPLAQFTSINQGCTPLPVSFSNTSQRAVRYEWDYGDGSLIDPTTSPVRIFENNLALANRNLQVILKAISASGCQDTALRTLTIFPLPLVDYSVFKTQRCDTAEFATNNATQGAVSYQWRNPNLLVSTNPNPFVYFRTARDNDTTYQLKLIATSANGCRDSVSKPVLVRPLVDANFFTDSVSSCSNLQVNFTNTSRNANSYFWEFGDGSGSPLANPKHRYTSTGAYGVTLIAYDRFGCSDTVFKNNLINVFEVPVANFTYTPPFARLPNSTIQFSNSSFISSGDLQYLWQFNDPVTLPNTATNQNPSFTFSDSGNFKVSLRVNTLQGCVDSTDRTIRIEPHLPITNFSIDLPSGCLPHTVNFSNLSQFADTYFWDFGDANQSTETNPSHTYTLPNTYNVYLRARGPGGVDDTLQSAIITVFPLPRANFIVTPLKLIIPNSTITLTDISLDAVAWKWKISDGLTTIFESQLQSTDYTFSQEGVFDVELIAVSKDGCEDTLVKGQLVNVLKGGSRLIANAFTPNDDGVNDVFKPAVSGVLREEYEFSIYDRWGQLLFKTNDINAAWDGIFGGKPATPDVYVWILKGILVGGDSFTDSGNVTLIR